jgi:hypothetical protein
MWLGIPVQDLAAARALCPHDAVYGEWPRTGARHMVSGLYVMGSPARHEEQMFITSPNLTGLARRGLILVVKAPAGSNRYVTKR